MEPEQLTGKDRIDFDAQEAELMAQDEYRGRMAGADWAAKHATPELLRSVGAVQIPRNLTAALSSQAAWDVLNSIDPPPFDWNENQDFTEGFFDGLLGCWYDSDEYITSKAK